MAFWSLLAPPRSYMWFGAAVPGWSSLDPRLSCKPPHLFPWSLSQLHPLLCREEGSTGCAKMPGYRGGTLTCSVLWAKGWHLCSGLLSLPWPKHTPDDKRQEPVTAISTCHEECHSKLPMAGHSARNDAFEAWSSQRRLLVSLKLSLYLSKRIPIQGQSRQ